jgi:hypothetical protein
MATKERIRRAIRHLKNGKVPGTDSILPEAIQMGGRAIIKMLHVYTLFRKIWETEILQDRKSKAT